MRAAARTACRQKKRRLFSTAVQPRTNGCARPAMPREPHECENPGTPEDMAGLELAIAEFHASLMPVWCARSCRRSDIFVVTRNFNDARDVRTECRAGFVIEQPTSGAAVRSCGM